MDNPMHKGKKKNKAFPSFVKDFVKIRPKTKSQAKANPQKIRKQDLKFQIGFCLWKTQALFWKILTQNTTSDGARVQLLQ